MCRRRSGGTPCNAAEAMSLVVSYSPAIKTAGGTGHVHIGRVAALCFSMAGPGGRPSLDRKTRLQQVFRPGCPMSPRSPRLPVRCPTRAAAVRSKAIWPGIGRRVGPGIPPQDTLLVPGCRARSRCTASLIFRGPLLPRWPVSVPASHCEQTGEQGVAHHQSQRRPQVASGAIHHRHRHDQPHVWSAVKMFEMAARQPPPACPGSGP